MSPSRHTFQKLEHLNHLHLQRAHNVQSHTTRQTNGKFYLDILSNNYRKYRTAFCFLCVMCLPFLLFSVKCMKTRPSSSSLSSLWSLTMTRMELIGPSEPSWAPVWQWRPNPTGNCCFGRSAPAEEILGPKRPMWSQTGDRVLCRGRAALPACRSAALLKILLGLLVASDLLLTHFHILLTQCILLFVHDGEFTCVWEKQEGWRTRLFLDPFFLGVKL